jgi:hypothetical protein
MTITLNLDPSWTAVPHAFARIMASLAALERPRQPGEDLDDLSELLSGMDDPEPAPAAPAVARPSPAASPATPPAGRFNGTPTTGQQLYKFCCQTDTLKRANAIGKSRGWPKLLTQWDAGMVAEVYRELTAEPAPNGRPH